MERVTQLMTSQTVLANLENQFNQLSTTTDELSSGLKISQPSDDPYGASVALQLNDAISSLGQYSTNVQDGTAWAQTAGTALTDISNVIQTVQGLVVEGGGGTLSQSQMTSAASEVNQLIDQIKQDANTTYDGNYIFSGSALETQPYQTGSNDAYQGNTGSVSRQIGPGVSVSVNVSISQLLGNGTSANDGLLLDTLRTISSDLSSGNTSALQSTDLDNLQSNQGTLEQMQATMGALSSRLQLASSRITTTTSDDQSALASDQDTDMATAAVTYSTEQAAYEAALKASASIVQSSLLDFLTTA